MKRLVLQGFTISPVIHAIDIDVPIPTIEAQQYGQQFVGPGELGTWEGENWPDVWASLVSEFTAAQEAAANAAVEANRTEAKAARPARKATKRTAKKPAR